MPTAAMIPLFIRYTVSELAGEDYPNGLLPYTESYLHRVKEGRLHPTEKFIKTACGILNRSREELFGVESVDEQ